MRLTIVAVVLVAVLSPAGCSTTTEHRDTYKVQKGGMSSTVHEMKQ